MSALRLGVCLDPPEEGWHSMDVVGEGLLHGLQAHADVVTVRLRSSIPSLARRLPALARSAGAFNVDRVVTRHL
ncbi:MAG: glycosyltransferase family 1 protein, partial [Myxococcaceae bacterium]|nr:glycosyltransferase family 1 protein [Myxococcaceae bacterium]